MTDFYDQEESGADLRVVPDLTSDVDGEIDLTVDPYAVPDVEELLDLVITELAEARTSPMSTMAKVNRDELLDLVEQARELLPQELRRARWLLKEKEEFLANAEREREVIIDQGRTEIARLVERQAIVQAAEEKARSIVEEARAERRVMKRQTEDFCDQKLAAFEVLLERTGATIRQGRHKLLGAAGDESPMIAASGPPPPGAGANDL